MRSEVTLLKRERRLCRGPTEKQIIIIINEHILYCVWPACGGKSTLKALELRTRCGVNTHVASGCLTVVEATYPSSSSRSPRLHPGKQQFMAAHLSPSPSPPPPPATPWLQTGCLALSEAVARSAVSACFPGVCRCLSALSFGRSAGQGAEAKVNSVHV